MLVLPLAEDTLSSPFTTVNEYLSILCDSSSSNSKLTYVFLFSSDFRSNMNTPPTSNDMAMDQVPSDLIQEMEIYVEEYMSHYDASHDYNHIKRVLGLAHIIMAKEEERQVAVALQKGIHPSTNNTTYFNSTLVILGALLHDVGDKKYLQPGQDARTLVRDVLLEKNCPVALATRVQDLVLGVSFSSEIKDPQRVLDQIERIPELAIVQDADRLDAIGAVGIARCFAFTGAKSKSKAGLGSAIDHFGEKLVLLEGMMKTETGRLLATQRTERVGTFMGWWTDEHEILA